MDEAELKRDILEFLTQIGAKHETVEHPAAPTVEEHTQYVGGMGGQAKQLFLKDKKGNFVLLSCLKDQEIDMKVLSERLGIKRTEPLRMVRYEDTTKMLKVAPGSVTPFSVKYCGPEVRLLLDSNFKKYDKLLFHPMVNTATTLISPADTERFLEALERKVEWVDFSATDRIGDAPEAAAAAGSAAAKQAPASARKPQQAAPAAAPAAEKKQGQQQKHAATEKKQGQQQKQVQVQAHHPAAAEVVHWRKKGWDWDTQGRPCGELEVKKTWAEAPMYSKPDGWAGP